VNGANGQLHIPRHVHGGHDIKDAVLHAARGYRRTPERSPEFFDEYRSEIAVEALIHHRAMAVATAAITLRTRLTSCLMTW
jgi:hypothetical protein